MAITQKDIDENKSLKQYKLSVEDKEYIDSLSAITGVPSSTVREVFLGILLKSALSKESENFKINIPYLGTIEVEDEARSSSVKINESAYNFFNKFNLGEDTWIEEVIITKIKKNLIPKLELPIQ
jgi:hypothetical protein